jgi:aminobenzoyl-glutamate transport protein
VQLDKQSKRRFSDRFLDLIEKYGNKLPQPTTLFVILALLVVLGSQLAYSLNASVTLQQLSKETGTLVENEVFARSLLTPDGIRFMLENSVTNFTGFAPVGVVLVSLFGVAAADGTGLLRAIVKKLLYGVNGVFLTAMVVFLGVMSNVASDAGYVVVIPIGAMIFKSLGKNPIAGIAAGFMGVSGGFSANLLLGSIDPMLGGLSTLGAQVIDPKYVVPPTANYYFMAVSTILVTAVGTYVTERIIEPRLNKAEAEANAEAAVEQSIKIEPLTENEKKGLRYSLWAFIVGMAVTAMLVLPKGAVLRNQQNGDILTNSPFVNSIVIIITLLFFVSGVAYGIGAKVIKNDKDLLDSMEGLVNTMGGYLIMTFVAAQFVAYFRYSNLGTIIAVNGASVLKSTGLVGIPLLVVLTLLTSVLNLVIGSSVTLWSIMAPVFVPMFMMLNIPPELTQCAYRIGDSATNIVSPLMPFFGVVLAIASQYKKDIGIGTLMSIMIPYAAHLLISWIILFAAWVLLGIPLGPGIITRF